MDSPRCSEPITGADSPRCSGPTTESLDSSRGSEAATEPADSPRCSEPATEAFESARCSEPAAEPAAVPLELLDSPRCSDPMLSPDSDRCGAKTFESWRTDACASHAAGAASSDEPCAAGRGGSAAAAEEPLKAGWVVGTTRPLRRMRPISSRGERSTPSPGGSSRSPSAALKSSASLTCCGGVQCISSDSTSGVRAAGGSASYAAAMVAIASRALMLEVSVLPCVRIGSYEGAPPSQQSSSTQRQPIAMARE